MKADLHIHTHRFSGCSIIEPEKALKRAAELGFGMIALTEHGIRWPNDELDRLIKKSGVKDLVVIPGQEAACYSLRGEFQGEFLVFGYPESLGSNKTAQQLIEMVHAQKGVVVAAHPFKKKLRGEGYYGCGNDIYDLDVDGLEIIHPSYEKKSLLLARQVMKKKKIAGLGCSDAHALSDIGCCWSELENTVHDELSLCQSIRAGRVKAMGLIDDPVDLVQFSGL